MHAPEHARLVALLQYPHYSCTTTGSSLNHFWRELVSRGLQSKFVCSVIDRWPTHPTFIQALTQRILLGLEQFPEEFRSQVR